MADGLFNLVGPREVVFTHNDRTYTMMVRTLADFAAYERFILRRTVSPYIGIEHLTEDVQKVAAAAAAAQAARPHTVTLADVLTFDDTYQGMAYRLWQALSARHADEFPAGVPEEAGVQLGLDFIEWVGPERLSDLRNALYEVDENDILGNSDGPTQTEAGQSGGIPEPSRGQGSSENLVQNTDTPSVRLAT